MGQQAHFFDDGINPKFVFHSKVSSLELDPSGNLPSAGVMRHVQQAIDIWCEGAREPFVVGDSHLETLHEVVPALHAPSAGHQHVDGHERARARLPRA